MGRCTMAWIMLMLLTGVSVASRVKPNAVLKAAVSPMKVGAAYETGQPCTDEEVSVGSCGIKFLDYLIQRKNPKNGLCENVPAPNGGTKSRKRKHEARRGAPAIPVNTGSKKKKERGKESAIWLIATFFSRNPPPHCPSS